MLPVPTLQVRRHGMCGAVAAVPQLGDPMIGFPPLLKDGRMICAADRCKRERLDHLIGNSREPGSPNRQLTSVSAIREIRSSVRKRLLMEGGGRGWVGSSVSCGQG